MHSKPHALACSGRTAVLCVYSVVGFPVRHHEEENEGAAPTHLYYCVIGAPSVESAQEYARQRAESACYHPDSGFWDASVGRVKTPTPAHMYHATSAWLLDARKLRHSADPLAHVPLSHLEFVFVPPATVSTQQVIDTLTRQTAPIRAEALPAALANGRETCPPIG